MENEFEIKEIQQRKIFQILGATGRQCIILLFAGFILIPLYIVILTSLKTSVEANGTLFTWWPREGFSLDGYKQALNTSSEARNLFRAFGVTLWFGCMCLPFSSECLSARWLRTALRRWNLS